MKRLIAAFILTPFFAPLGFIIIALIKILFLSNKPEAFDSLTGITILASIYAIPTGFIIMAIWYPFFRMFRRRNWLTFWRIIGAGLVASFAAIIVFSTLLGILHIAAHPLETAKASLGYYFRIFFDVITSFWELYLPFALPSSITCAMAFYFIGIYKNKYLFAEKRIEENL